MWKSTVLGARREGQGTLSRLVVLVPVVAMGLATTQCTWDGLDAYSAQYGKALVDAGDGGSGGNGGGLVDAAVCDCEPGQACVLGQCETCTPTWSYDHKALRQGDTILLDHLYDASRKTLYVSSSRQDGQGPRRGYLAEVDTCRGMKLRDFDGPTAADGSAVPGLLMSGRVGDTLFFKAMFEDPSKMAGYAVYDMNSSSFVRTVWVDPWKPGASLQYAWGMDVTSSGKVWLIGEFVQTMPGPSYPLVMQSDGMGKTCVNDVPSITGSGRSVAGKNGDVYLTIATTGPASEVRVLHYAESSCDIASCNCPVTDELPPLALPGWGNVLGAKVLGSVLVVGGIYVKSGEDFGAFLAQYNFAAKAWGSMYTFDSTPLLEGVTAVGGDASTAYVAMVENYSFTDPLTANMQVFAIDFPISSNSMAKKVPVSALRAAFGLDLDGDGMILSGYSSGSIADGRSIRCTLDTCP